MSRFLVVALLCAFVLPASAYAHGETTTTDPAAGARLQQVPKQITIDFSEPPTKESKYAVRDGCRLDVLTSIEGRGRVRTLTVFGGQPGRWTVSYNVISAIDGHQTQDRFQFSVAGKRDCARPSDEETPVESTPPPAVLNDDEPSSFPVVPVVVGVLIVIGALALRRFSSR